MVSDSLQVIWNRIWLWRDLCVFEHPGLGVPIEGRYPRVAEFHVLILGQAFGTRKPAF